MRRVTAFPDRFTLLHSHSISIQRRLVLRTMLINDLISLQ